MFRPRPHKLEEWEDVTKTFHDIEPPRLDIDDEGDVIRKSWVFRGHKRLDYRLQPSIEREAERKGRSWRALEVIALAEFQSKARLHMNSRDVPDLDKLLDWLALMQHYGVPTRLLDVTYSPYVALYFAIRSRSETERKKPAAVWAFNASELLDKGRAMAWQANGKQKEYDRGHGRPVAPRRRRVFSDPGSARTDADTLLQDEHDWQSVCEGALSAIEARREFYNDNGFVAFACPPIQNQRLATQQGAFLFNGAENLTFEDSLSKWADRNDDKLCKLFIVPANKTEEFEKRLFQMNIHELSLFPDMEGLAGFIRQKIQLHWLVPG